MRIDLLRSVITHLSR